jgi:LysM repeat protein
MVLPVHQPSPMRPAAAALLLAVLLPLPGLAGEVVVKPGETLSEIAERYGTTSERLMQLNGLRSAKDLWAGSTIRVPGAGGSGGSTGGGNGNYTVKPGETLSEIAERYGTTSERLMQLNGLRSAKDLWAGSRIEVPGASPARPSTASRPPVNRNAREHNVQAGETLSEIADRYGIPMSRLVALNGLAKPNELQAGSTLKLRGTAATTSPRPPAKPAVRPATQPAVASTPAAPRQASRTTAPATRPASTTAAVRPASTTVATATPAARPASSPATAATPATSTATATTVATTSVSAAPVRPNKPATPDWRSYGPLQVDWANWQPMAGSFVAPSLNSDGQPLYLAVNCNARRLNATGQSGTWNTWDAPKSDSEEQLIADLCKAKGG